MSSEDVSYMTCNRCAKLFGGSHIKTKFKLHKQMCKATLTTGQYEKKTYVNLANKLGMSADQYADKFKCPRMIEQKTKLDGKSKNIDMRGADIGVLNKNIMRGDMCGFCYDITHTSHHMDCGQLEPVIVCKSCIIKALTYKECDFCDNCSKSFVKPVEIDGKSRWACLNRCYSIHI